MSDKKTDNQLSPLFKWRRAIVASDLKPTSRLVALTLSMHMNANGGSAFPGGALLASETGLSEKPVYRHLDILVTKGWLQIQFQGGGRGKATEYVAIVPNPVPGTPFRQDETQSLVHPLRPETQYLETVNPVPGDRKPSTRYLPGRKEDVIEEVTLGDSTLSSSPYGEIFDALTEAFGVDPDKMPDGEAKRYGSVAKQLVAIEATPDDIRRKHHNLTSRGWPNGFTPNGLVANWSLADKPAGRSSDRSSDNGAKAKPSALDGTVAASLRLAEENNARREAEALTDEPMVTLDQVRSARIGTAV